ncbi:hypothetical protein NQ176_g2844 [Zarea fungicola]|uniref:Uncharacterized protein n=1 Tax=Zarea fungicola TaxID=93591 RepID=A0ACC1NNK5_9HYPO|nr:hypothetical protein NQ176_g2844 [Lecanicillium fungicola]
MFNSGRTSLWRKPTSTTRASRTGLSIVCFQFLQLALMLIARKGHGRPFSQLEAVTLGFAICDSVDYLLFMYKQQRVERGLALDTPGTKYDINFAHKTYDRFWDVLKNDTVNDHSTTVPQSRHDSPALPTNMVTPPQRITNDNVARSSNGFAHPGLLLLAVASALFGPLHAIAWDFEFPSAFEKTMWRVVMVTAAASPFLGLPAVLLAQWTRSCGNGHGFINYRWLRPFEVEASSELYTRDFVTRFLWSGFRDTFVDALTFMADFMRLMREASGAAVQDPESVTSLVPYADIFRSDDATDLVEDLLSFLNNDLASGFVD